MNIDKLNINFLMLDSEVLEVVEKVIPLPPNRKITIHPPNFLPLSPSAIVWLLREKVVESFLTFKDYFDYCVQIIPNTSLLFQSEKLLSYWEMEQKQKTSIVRSYQGFLLVRRKTPLENMLMTATDSHCVQYCKFKTINLIYPNF